MSTENLAALVIRGPQPDKKYFDLDEANRALVYITRIVDDIVACYREAVDVRQSLDHPNPDDESGGLEDNYEVLMDRLSDLTDELSFCGAELKDYERGLVDFPAIHEGREIYLCWKAGEKTVTTWHEIDAGFSGRQSIETLEVSA